MNLNWIFGVKDRKETTNVTASSTPSGVVLALKKDLECTLRTFLD